MQFDSRGGFSGSGYLMKTQPSRVSKGLVAMATNFGTKIAINLVYIGILCCQLARYCVIFSGVFLLILRLTTTFCLYLGCIAMW